MMTMTMMNVNFSSETPNAVALSPTWLVVGMEWYAK
jgi:hypothetical protein